MYAIFETGGKQYKVEAGDVLRIEKISGSAGDTVKFENVIAFSGDDGSLKTGTPYLDAATVNATITGVGRGEKVIIFKFKAKKDYRKKQGHRQPYTEIEIDGFTIGGKGLGVKPEKPAKAAVEAVADEKEADPIKEKQPVAKEKPAKAAKPVEEVAVPVDAADADKVAGSVKEEKTASRMTKADIMAKLDELEIDYAKSAKKDELLAILAEAEGK
jgi:large subunit ribosomal protein L21